MLLNSYGDGACALNLGGMDKTGKSQLNDLSKILIEVEKEISGRSPIIAVRVTPDMPDDFMDSVVDFSLFKIGQPTFYGEETCRQSMLDRGFDEADAVNFSANSCMGIISAGNEIADMWGIKYNSHLPLELAVNGGKPFDERTPYESEIPLKTATSFEDILLQYIAYNREIMSKAADTYELLAREMAENLPNPFLSAITEGCISARKDRAVGAKYNTVTVETMGLINVCDALLAIKELVYEKKKYTLADLIVAAKRNYEGYETLRKDILNCKKYGANDRDANALCNRLCKAMYSACKEKWHGNRLFLPSLHTIDMNVYYGSNIGTTLDGRLRSEPLNKNANPSELIKKCDPTSVMLSAAALEQYKLSGGQPIDLYFDKDWFETKEKRDKIKQLILTYFKLGGMQLQVNSIDIELLEKAHKQPEKHPQVIVRKGGYSVRFNQMPERVREEFILRARSLRG